MNKKALKITAIIIVVAMLVLGVALTICGLIYTANEDNIAFLVFLDNAGADDKFVCEMLGYLEENYQIMMQCLSGETPPSETSLCQFYVDLAELFGRLNSNDLGNAIYGYLHDKASFGDVGMISKYPSIIRYRDLIKRFGQSQDGIVAKMLEKCKAVSYEQIQVISSQFVELCNYIYLSGKDSLSYTLDAMLRAIRFKAQLADHVSLREIFTSLQYISNGLAKCDDIDVTFGVLNELTGNKVFETLSNTPQLIRLTLNFVGNVEIETVSEIISYTFYPNICVALLRELNKQNYLNDDNIDLISKEIFDVFSQLGVENSDFKQFYVNINQIGHDGEYLFDPQSLTEEQEIYVSNYVAPIIDCFSNIFN